MSTTDLQGYSPSLFLSVAGRGARVRGQGLRVIE